MPPIPFSPPATHGAGEGAPRDESDERLRLPRTVEPHRYRLTIAPDLDAGTFSGRLDVELSVLAPTSELVCNAADLEIDDAHLVTEDATILPATVTLETTEERAIFSAPRPLQPGPARLRCRFDGSLNDKLRGFYRSTFVDGSGARRLIAATQMEATDARRAFPCWDEPDRKAVFEVTLEVPEGLAAFSNSPVAEEQELADGRRAVRFAPTMKMSTYLVAFVVGPLEATPPRIVDGTPLRVVHVPGKKGLTAYALDVAEHALGFFSRYFDLPYPADKLDLVAIPDFAFGAMENLGCVTFRETALLVDPARAARTELERVADVVCHEIAHMWFGDLVTMRWWNGIWLNEAFATFMEILCVDAFRPEWQRWTSFGLEREAALAVDGLHATRPVEYPVGRPEEAEGMFDVLTYQKGGSLLRMLEQYIGPEVFRDGVRAYLRHHAHANTETEDLWTALESVSGEPVRSVMGSWILQGGYPLVVVEDSALSQEPFTYGAPRQGEESAIGGPWEIPVLARTVTERGRAAGRGTPVGRSGNSGSEGGRLLLGTAPVPLASLPGASGERPGASGERPGASGEAALLVNAGGWGYYRVAYPSAHLARLGAHLRHLDTLERANLLADTWGLVLAGRGALEDFFTLAGRLGDDEDPATWTFVAAALSLIDHVISSQARPTLEAATRGLLSGPFTALGWSPRRGEHERTPALRALLLRTLGTIGRDPAVQAHAATLFDEAQAARRSPHGSPAAQAEPRAGIDPDIEAAVLEIVANQNRPGDLDALLEVYRHPSTPQEEMRYLLALTAFRDPALAERLFTLALTEVRAQNAHFVIQGMLANREVGPVAWEHVKREWSALTEKLPANTATRMVEGARALCGDPALAEDVTDFLRSHPLRSGQRSVLQTVERLAVNVAFGARHREDLEGVLRPYATQDDTLSP